MPRANSGAVSGLELLEGVFSLGIRLCAIAILLVTGYYIYGTVAASNELFRGTLGTGAPMSVPQFQQHVQNMQLLIKVLTLASVLLIVCVLGRYYAYAEAGAALLVLGALLFLGMPLLIDGLGGPQAGLPRPLARLGNPRAYLMDQYRFVGMVLSGAGFLHLLVHAVLFVAQFRERRPQPNAEHAKTAAQVRKVRDKFLGKCWDLPFCRDTDKKLCPIRSTGKACWRTGRGCYCDQNVILTLSGGGQFGAGRVASGYASRAATTIVKPKSLSEKREQCLGCPVYLHHQSQKYKVLAPLSLLALIAGIGYFWSTLQTGYPVAVKAMGRALSGFSFGSSAGQVPGWAAEMAANTGMMWLLLIVACLMALAYVLHGLEWVLYRLGV